ncbi:serine hydrolase domain-containing protein [Deinococcus hopiensis]|uniref:CubicO group peptidase, beta-lactamase class C family n=1 Tax=Deinococcus hopiensis KR-140 TaxID=695939 RepID=A0A1W1UFG8_9DEIO|nr:serine hydrolase [Deinococcus hopiensis]SMB79827.1 CubicO group peptidase, beta-lactamase class C family [Deinococcus hopiensis KR-140]
MIPGRTQALLAQALEAGLCGAALGVVTAGGGRDTLFLGQAAREPELLPLTEDTFWDLASLTKPLFTAREVLRASEEGLIDLDDTLGTHLPDLAWMQETGLKSRTLRQVLTHSAGLPAWAPLYTWGDAALIRARVLQEPWHLTPPGEVVYSDLGYVLLGLLLERVRGQALRDFTLPPGLTFTPDPSHSAATERCPWRARVLRGETHDENGFALGGASGHAGLFGTLAAVLDQAQALLRGGWLSPAAQAAAVRLHVPGRTLAFVAPQPGWSGGGLCSPNAFGHTGFTGTGFWVDPERGLAWALLTNRVHPSRHTSTDIQALRRAVGNTLLAAQG